MKPLKFNPKQKITFYITLSIIVLSFVFWFAYGQEIFTKTEVLVDIKDEIFDRTYHEWRKKFIWGLDLTLAITGVTAILSIIIIYFQKNKKETK